MLFKKFPRLKSKNQLINTIAIQIMVSINRWGRTCLRISIGNNERIKWGIRLVVGHSRLVLTNDAIIGRGIYLFLLTRAWASTCARAFTTTWLWLPYWWRWSRGSQAICWFEQAANRTKLDNPVTNAKTLFFISKPKFLFSNPYSVVPELTSAL